LSIILTHPLQDVERLILAERLLRVFGISGGKRQIVAAPTDELSGVVAFNTSGVASMRILAR